MVAHKLRVCTGSAGAQTTGGSDLLVKHAKGLPGEGDVDDARAEVSTLEDPDPLHVAEGRIADGVWSV